MTNIIQILDAEQLRKDIPEFKAGDTVVVQVKVKEGSRERLQAFEGIVIAKRNRGLNSAFTVRKISHGEGVERTFQAHSPMIASIKVKRLGKVRRAKLYYLRELSGRAARIKERIIGKGKKKAQKEKVETPVKTESVEEPAKEKEPKKTQKKESAKEKSVKKEKVKEMETVKVQPTEVAKKSEPEKVSKKAEIAVAETEKVSKKTEAAVTESEAPKESKEKSAEKEEGSEKE